MDVYADSCSTKRTYAESFAEAIKTAIEKYAEVEENKLKFEIAKYKYENPQFRYE